MCVLHNHSVIMNMYINSQQATKQSWFGEDSLGSPATETILGVAAGSWEERMIWGDDKE